MKGTSKFEYASFDDGGWQCFFAVSKQKYTQEEANNLFEQEIAYEAEICKIHDCAVRWRAGINEDGEPVVGWWLELDADGTEPRCCPVWAFEY